MPSRRTLLHALGVGIVPFSGCGNRVVTPTQTPAESTTKTPTGSPTESPTESPTSSPTETEPPVREFTCETEWTPTVQWSLRTDTRAYPPTVADGKVYFGSQDGYVRAAEANTGQLRWRFSQRLPLYSKVYVNDGIVTMGGYEQALALDSQTGEERWSFKLPGTIPRLESTADDGSNLYIGASQHPTANIDVQEEYDRVYALDRQSGKIQWVTELSAPRLRTQPSQLSVDNSRVYAGTTDGETFCLEAASGMKIWTREFDGGTSGFASGGGTLFRGGYDSLYALSASTGRTRWTKTALSVTDLVLGENVYATHDGILSAYQRATGEIVWQARSPKGRPLDNLGLISGTIYTKWSNPPESARLYGYDSETGCRRGYATVNSSGVTAPAQGGDLLFFGGMGGEGRMWAVSAP